MSYKPMLSSLKAQGVPGVKINIWDSVMDPDCKIANILIFLENVALSIDFHQQSDLTGFIDALLKAYTDGLSEYLHNRPLPEYKEQ